MILLTIIAIFFFTKHYLEQDINMSLKYGILAVSLYTLIIYIHGISDLSILISIIGIISMTLSLNVPKKLKQKFSMVSIFIIGLLFFIVDHSEGTLLIFTALIISTIATYSKSILKMKILYFLSNILWLSFGFYIGSTEAIIFDIVGFFALITFFVKYNQSTKVQ